MRLQQLDISGFKSFSDRAQLAFDRGVTAIVGPNGCGKSNLADAITWVLGEQSAKSLRGDRMEDVIFSGSDARKPTAAAEVRAMFAEVLVRAANGNGNGNGQGNGLLDEGAGEALQTRSVEITRRLYRSGESEYLIDGEVCRLRDVHELLMDTGLGAKAYAIIEQGKIGMILSSRPTDRRQLIEEAAGVTKYKARRRAAELKLEASQQNLTRIDDIIFEIEKQVNALKRQAAKARRYKRLRGELRQWEKILFVRKYRELAQTIEAVRAKLARARDEESAANAGLAGVESEFSRVRVDLAEEEAAATRAREAVHAHELEMSRRQQQIQLDEQHVGHLRTRAQQVATELNVLEARREPGLAAVAERRQAATRAAVERDQTAVGLQRAEADQTTMARRIEGLEADVEAARAEVFAALNSATALRHAVEHAGLSRERVNEQLSKLDLELAEVARELERVNGERTTASQELRRVQQSAEASKLARSARDAELASARIELEWRRQSLHTMEREVAALSARLGSLEELDSARAGYTDAAKMLLAEADDRVQQMGSVADCLEVEPRYERAVEACLGDLLQHVIVPHTEHALAALQIVSEAKVGRCGLLVVAPSKTTSGELGRTTTSAIAGLRPIGSVLRIDGPASSAIRAAIGEAWIAESLEAALAAAAAVSAPVVTVAGEVVRGLHVVSGGLGNETLGILAVKREIRELRERLTRERAGVARCRGEVSTLETAIAQAVAAVAALSAEQHRQEKTIVALEFQLQRATEDAARLGKKADLIETERHSAEDERQALDARQTEARSSIARLEQEQQAADERLGQAQRRLLEARETLDELNHRAAEGKAAYAALTERAAALAADVTRLEEAASELDERAAACRADAHQTAQQRAALEMAIRDNKQQLDSQVSALDELRAEVRRREDQVSSRRGDVDRREAAVREARHRLQEVRESVAALDLDRATAESHLTHLATSCVDTVQTTLDDIVAEIEQLEASPGLAVPSSTIAEPSVAEEEGDDGEEPLEASEVDVPQGELSPEDVIAGLRSKLDRLGAVNMMAIEQFDELLARHTFLSTQRKDLVDSIVATGATIKRIDDTTKQRFRDAFDAINVNFQQTFSTLFGGGRAGLTLLDENDLLETGIEIIAQPPGKRLQSVQLLSGGEKALTAIALMFAIFKYKPSPFCVLDEIDAPLDDANIGRFVEMLKGMLQHTQFILITHNRKTMEIADRLYGVTMEEPGVSKLVSLQLN